MPRYFVVPTSTDDFVNRALLFWDALLSYGGDPIRRNHPLAVAEKALADKCCVDSRGNVWLPQPMQLLWSCMVRSSLPVTDSLRPSDYLAGRPIGMLGRVGSSPC